MTISQRMFEILKKKNLSQSDLAKRLNLSPSTISTWKKENTDPPTNKLLEIADYLGVSVNYLLGREDKTPDITFTVSKSGNPFMNEAVWDAYVKMDDIQKLRVQIYILEISKGQNNEE